jgi:hypothetical protein
MPSENTYRITSLLPEKHLPRNAYRITKLLDITPKSTTLLPDSNLGGTFLTSNIACYHVKYGSILLQESRLSGSYPHSVYERCELFPKLKFFMGKTQLLYLPEPKSICGLIWVWCSPMRQFCGGFVIKI